MTLDHQSFISFFRYREENTTGRSISSLHVSRKKGNPQKETITGKQFLGTSEIIQSETSLN